MKTKIRFFKILNEFSLENNIFFNDLFRQHLDIDNRNKLLPILSSIVNNEPNLQNPKLY